MCAFKMFVIHEKPFYDLIKDANILLENIEIGKYFESSPKPFER
ncbi:hypothetical protein HPSA20_1629 [Helicobacter pylori SouthAfrica20]|uniref:Uncharacterized protein n=1 Tax=Helicobacter pylori SouthAfrica20 TaxID=1352356 RepID=T1UBT7_HELPX|nr:hypothetical protein HPSA20_1629 [Helicobacter pylori SouthAfrica20]